MSPYIMRVLWLNSVDRQRVLPPGGGRADLGGKYMSRVRLRTPLFGALGTALIAGVVFLGGAGAADAKDSEAQTKSYQKQFLDPQAPIGTEAKSSKKKASTKVTLDSPVETKAADPDSASDLTALADTSGGSWGRLPSLPSGSNAYHLIMGPGGKILLIAGSGNNERSSKLARSRWWTLGSRQRVRSRS